MAMMSVDEAGVRGSLGLAIVREYLRRESKES